MCNQHVVDKVRTRIKQEGPPSVSRRSFLKMGSLLAAGAAMAPRVARADMHEAGVVDLSQVLSPDNHVHPVVVPATREAVATVEENFFYSQRWVLEEHQGTHLDFPSHFIADGARADVYPADGLVGPAVVIDISDRAQEDPDAEVTVEDLQAWEMANGEIPEGAFVLMDSGWEQLIGSPAYLGDESGLHFPGFSAEAAGWLISERSIHGVGVDTISIDRAISETFGAHFNILGAGLVAIEGLVNLAAISQEPATIVCGVPRFQEGSGGPARVLALTGM